MGNLFVNLPLPVLNGPGAAVATDTMGWDKTLVFAGDTNGATVAVEASVDGGVVFQPVAVFQGGNYKKVIGVAAQFMRVNVTNRNALQPFSANIDVGANDNGALFAALPLPAGNGAGAPVDVSAFGQMRTFIVGGAFPGAVVEIQASEDGIDWAPCLSFAGRGDIENKPQTSRFYRTFVRNRRQTFSASVAVGGANDSISATTPTGAGILSLYGDGSFGDYVTAGDETWTSVAGAPGAPPAPAGSAFPFAFFDNLTISAGNSVAVGSDTENAVVIFVRDTLTIGAGARIHANGFPGTSAGFPIPNGGPGRRAIVGSQDGGDGGDGGTSGAGSQGAAGTGGTRRPIDIGAGGAGGNTTAGGVGGAGGVSAAEPSWPYSLSHAIGVASLLYAIGGGNGGGGGGRAGNGIGGGGGGGGGTLVIFAKTIVAPAASLQARGGAGGNGVTVENSPGGGGGGGTGGTVLVVTENATLVGVTSVTGGAGGLGAGAVGDPGAAGGVGEAIAINPMLAAQIPA